jgi:hypothetical protein
VNFDFLRVRSLPEGPSEAAIFLSFQLPSFSGETSQPFALTTKQGERAQELEPSL